MAKKNVFLVMWCNEGLECIIPVDPDLESTYHFNKLANNPDADKEAKALSGRLWAMKLRAQVNNQRNYEIYILETIDISKEELEHLFNVSPQVIVDLIREKGKKLYGNKPASNRIVIR